VGFLIDTCVWIDVERGVLAPADVAAFTGDEPIYLSPITIAELKFGAEIAADAHIRQRCLSALARLRRKPLLAIDGDTGEIFGQLVAQLKTAARKPRHRIGRPMAREFGDSALVSLSDEEQGGFRGHTRIRFGDLHVG
jgi:predicted nucleic acid-binding protein